MKRLFHISLILTFFTIVFLIILKINSSILNDVNKVFKLIHNSELRRIYGPIIYRNLNLTPFIKEKMEYNLLSATEFLGGNWYAISIKHKFKLNNILEIYTQEDWKIDKDIIPSKWHFEGLGKVEYISDQDSFISYNKNNINVRIRIAYKPESEVYYIYIKINR